MDCDNNAIYINIDRIKNSTSLTNNIKSLNKDNLKSLQKKFYKLPILKKFCKNNKLKVSGNKTEVFERVYNFLSQSYNATLIQKTFRRYLVYLYLKLMGPGIYNICKNDSDFFTLEPIEEISRNHFFSFKENDNIWGFDIISIYNLFVKNTNKDVRNPYTRNIIDNKIFNNIKQFIRINKIFNQPINIILDNNDNIMTKEQNLIKIFEIFQKINALGNYSDYTWLTTLTKSNLLLFIRELIDIWEYRAELTIETKRMICSPNGNPFQHININTLGILNYTKLQANTIIIINKLISEGISDEYCKLGASYVLCALTLVNSLAAEALPWLYYSVANVS